MIQEVSAEPVTWDTLARHALSHPDEDHEEEDSGNESDKKSGLDRCLELYKIGLKHVECEKALTGLLIDTLVDLSELAGISLQIKMILTRTLIRTLEEADSKGLLTEDHYEDWVSK